MKPQEVVPIVFLRMAEVAAAFSRAGRSCSRNRIVGAAELLAGSMSASVSAPGGAAVVSQSLVKEAAAMPGIPIAASRIWIAGPWSGVGRFWSGPVERLAYILMQCERMLPPGAA
jgi:hypothetical protein